MKRADIERIADVFKRALDTRDTRIEVLEQRLAELEGQPLLRARGIYGRVESYQRGDVVQHRGSAWVCATDSQGQEPAGSNTNWQLLARAGRDRK